MKSHASFDKIICAGKNYLDHALELGDSVPKEPLFFFKPPSCLVESPAAAVVMPHDRGPLHHECEIVYRISKSGGTLSFDAVTLGLDLTLRDLQRELKKKGAPWEAAKAFPHSAVIGRWLPLFDEHLELPFELFVNDDLRQRATGSSMRRSPEELLREAGRLFTICDGDLFFTGTPAGVGPIATGDRLTLKWEKRLEYEVVFD